MATALSLLPNSAAAVPEGSDASPSIPSPAYMERGEGEREINNFLSLLVFLSKQGEEPSGHLDELLLCSGASREASQIS